MTIHSHFCGSKQKGKIIQIMDFKIFFLAQKPTVIFQKCLMLQAGLFLASACRWGVDLEACYRLQDGDWQGLLQTEGGDLPFLFRVEREAGPQKSRPSERSFKVRLQDGESVVESVAEVRGDSLYWPFPVFESVLVAAVSPLGDSLSGYWYKTKYDTGSAVPFRAHRGGQYKFASRSTRLPDEVGGLWSGDLGQGTPALMPLIQKGPELSGTIRTPYGDYRYLTGLMDGDSLWMSGMDGGSAYLLRGRLEENGTLQGMVFSAKGPGRPWTMVRDSNAVLPDPYGMAELRGKERPLSFRLKDIATDTLVSPGPPARATVVQMLGTWCPNCLDETEYLASIYPALAERGVQVIGLGFERTYQPAKAIQNLRKLQARYKVPYPLVHAGKPDSLSILAVIPQLVRLKAFPTTILLDSTGKIRYVHTGFDGPATGTGFEKQKLLFQQKINSLVGR
jgi:thiol-disulfide isomerase/thioredoxin